LCIFTYNSSPFLPELFPPVFGNYPFSLLFLFSLYIGKLRRNFPIFPSIMPYPSPHLIIFGAPGEYSFLIFVSPYYNCASYRSRVPRGPPPRFPRTIWVFDFLPYGNNEKARPPLGEEDSP